MLKVQRRGEAGPSTETPGPGWSVPEGTVWIDLSEPTREEELAVETALGLDLPTREEMAQIEPSSRLYQEDGATFMTATLIARSDEDRPMESPVTFVLAKGLLVTIRYSALKSFEAFATRCEHPGVADGAEALVGLLDAVVERLAAILEQTAARVETASTGVFQPRKKIAFQPLLGELARAQSRTSMARVSLMSLARLVSFAALAPEMQAESGGREHLRSLQRDVASLTEHAGHHAAHITFLLDAALGLINIEQNGIIKIFSVMAVVFMPPTLVASVYGMNFHHIPELSWPYGYPMALGMMVVSAVVPLLWFNRKGWL